MAGTAVASRSAQGYRSCTCRHPDCRERFLALAAAGPARRHTLRNRIVEDHLYLVRQVTGRYRHTAAPMEDLTQVAALALVEAADRFDPQRGVGFSTFAAATVSGAMKHFFRDAAWVLQTPRHLKELHVQIRAATDRLAQELGRQPGIADLAAYLAMPVEDIRAALGTDDAFHPLCLDAPLRTPQDEVTTLGGTLGTVDSGFRHVDEAQTLRTLLSQLPPRDRRVLVLRFFGNLTQDEIAEQVGCSQMHISRILKATLARLRQGVAGERPAPAPTPVRHRARPHRVNCPQWS